MGHVGIVLRFCVLGSAVGLMGKQFWSWGRSSVGMLAQITHKHVTSRDLCQLIDRVQL